MKSHTNVAAISSSIHEVLNLCLVKEEHSYNNWMPPLKKLRDTLQLSCEELDAHIPFRDEDYKAIKKLLTERFVQHRRDVRESTNQIESLEDAGGLIDRFDWLEDYIHDKKNLTSDGLYIVLYVLIDRFLGRLKDDDYADYYELSSLMEISSDNNIELVNDPTLETQPEILKRNETKEKELTYIQAAWVILFRGEAGNLSKRELAEKYRLSADNLSNHVGKCQRIRRFQGFKSERSWYSILNDLKVVIDYFKQRNEITEMDEAKKERNIVLQKSEILEDD